MYKSILRSGKVILAIIVVLTSLVSLAACIPAAAGAPQITMITAQVTGISPTATPAASPTATPTVRPTATPTVTPTVSPTVTPRPTVTVTPTPTVTVSPSPTVTVTPTPTPTVTPRPTVTPTATPTVSPAASPTVSPTATPATTPTTSPIPGLDVRISINVANFNISSSTTNAPGQGHVIFFMDVMPPSMAGQRVPTTGTGTSVSVNDTTYTWRNVTAGTHVFAVELVNADNTPLNPPILAAVAMDVEPAGPSATATPAASPTVSPTRAPSPTPTLTPSPTPTPTRTP